IRPCQSCKQEQSGHLLSAIHPPREAGLGDHAHPDIHLRHGRCTSKRALSTHGHKRHAPARRQTGEPVPCRSHRTLPAKRRAEATHEEWLLFQFCLCAGCREPEAMYAEWDASDFTGKLLHIRLTARFTPKDYEEREIPLPDFLVAALKQRLLNTKGKLIFPTA